MKKTRTGTRIATSLAALSLFATMALGVLAQHADALAINPTPKAQVSFTFDDGFESVRTQAASTLAQFGYTGTSYVITNCIGMNRVPNTCRADKQSKYMTWTQVKEMQSRFGWEIGSHTATHPLLASTDPEDQPNLLTADQVRAELVNSKNALAAQGINATAFAPPYGDYDPATLAEIGKYYTSMRGFADTGYNTWPYSDYLIRVQQVQVGVSVAQVKQYVDQAIANKQWLVLVFHDVLTNPSTNPDRYQYKTSDLKSIASYIKTKNVPVVNVSKGLTGTDTNLVANGNFANGISNGWTTDNAAVFSSNSGNNGNFPEATKSIAIAAGGTGGHLFSPAVNVDASVTYLLKNFLNVRTISSGEVSFYIDEYDGLGNWISGQYKGGERGVFTENFNLTYKPTTGAVKTAKLQIGVGANTGITGYLDNAQWFALNDPTPVTATNLVANGTFDAGIASGWTTSNAAAFTANSANNGSPANPVNSAAIMAGSANTYLFSPRVTVTNTKTYSLSTYANVTALASQELGFYIDEYDANGNWVSGQYKGGIRAVSKGDASFTYTPSSANVATASLQIILVGNSGITGFVDDIRWY